MTIYCRFSMVFAAGLLGGCAALQQGTVPTSAASAPTSFSKAAGIASHVRSWMAGGLEQRDLLYVSNANGTVSVYRYWQRTLAGVLTDFKQPMGECADPAGNVYIVDYQAEKIDEYAHGGKRPIKVFDDSPNQPYACAVSPPNGNLAVVSSPYGSNKSGNIAIYPGGSGKRIVMEGPKGSHFTGCAYDDRGDLLAMSEYRYSPFWYYAFSYLPRHGKKLLPMTLPYVGSSTQFGVIEGVAWDGKYWAVGPSYDDLYLYTINIKASYVGKIEFTTAGATYAGPIAVYRKASQSQGTQAVAGAGESTVDYWKYPAGGSPIGDITKDLDTPFGVAISLGTGGQ
jgi:hypothetical protein